MEILQLVDKADQLLPLFVTQTLGDIPCITGLFVAGVLSGALSTVSSGLSSLAAIAIQGWVQAGCKVRMSEGKKAFATKCISAVYGVLCFGVIYLIEYFPGVVKVPFLLVYIE